MTSTMRFESRDVTSVEETWRRFVPSAALQRADPENFRFHWFSAQLADVDVVHYRLDADVESRVEPEDQLLVCRVDSATAWVGSPAGDLDASRPWITDGRQVRSRWQGSAEVRALIFERAAAQRLARQISGHDGLHLRVSGLSARTVDKAQHWDRTFGYLVSSLEGMSEADELILAGLRRQALWTTLTTFPTSFGDALESPSQIRPAPTTVRRAVDYIDANAHRPITIDDVAAAVHISTRGLQYAFRRTLDTTPTEQLRRARLEGVHRDLLRGDGEPVAAVARRWGFAHPSRFATAYREAYGVSPSITARRWR